MLTPLVLRDIKGPVPETGFPIWGLLLGLFFLAFLLTGTFVMIRLRRKRRIVPALAPLDEALQGLASLADDSSAIDPKTFQERLSRTLRTFLSRQFAAGFLEMTTAEGMAAIRRDSRIEETAAEALIDLLTAGDRIRFSGDPPPARPSEAIIETARQLISELARTPEAPPV